MKVDKIPWTGFFLDIKKIEIYWRIDWKIKNKTILGLMNANKFESNVYTKKLYKNNPEKPDIKTPINADKKTYSKKNLFPLKTINIFSFPNFINVDSKMYHEKIKIYISRALDPYNSIIIFWPKTAINEPDIVNAIIDNDLILFFLKNRLRNFEIIINIYQTIVEILTFYKVDILMFNRIIHRI